MDLEVAQEAVDAIFDEGQAALYQAPDSGPAACRIIPARSVRRGELGQPISFRGSGFSIAMTRVDMLVRRSEVAAPVEGATLTAVDDAGAPLTYPDGQPMVWVLGGDGLAHDTYGLIWRCPTATGEPAE